MLTLGKPVNRHKAERDKNKLKSLQFTGSIMLYCVLVVTSTRVILSSNPFDFSLVCKGYNIENVR